MSEYATIDDIKAVYPQVAEIPNIDTIFTIYILPLVELNIDKNLFNLLDSAVKLLSLLLSMHYIVTLIPSYNTNPSGDAVWDSSDFEGKSGAISSLSVDKLSTAFQTVANLNNRESNFNETNQGKEYLVLLSSIRKRIGIDGKGNIWVTLQ